MKAQTEEGGAVGKGRRSWSLFPGLFFCRKMPDYQRLIMGKEEGASELVEKPESSPPLCYLCNNIESILYH